MKPEQSEFIKHDSGIISLIINTPKRWMDYWVCIDFKRDENDKPINGEYVVAVYLRDPDKEFSTRELFVEVGIDFDYRKYHQLEQQEKDQLVIYFIPMEMLLWNDITDYTGYLHKAKAKSLAFLYLLFTFSICLF